MTRHKMKPHLVILLLLSGLASLASAADETICELLAQHRYKDIGLQSITWHCYGKAVLLFTAPQTRYYQLPAWKVTRTSMDLSEAYPQSIENKCDYKTAYGHVSQTSLRGTYMFYLRKYSIFPVWRYYKHIVLMATDTGVLTGNFKCGWAQEVTNPDGVPFPDFSLGSIGYDGPVLNGYVLFSDEAQYIRIGQFQVHYAGSIVMGLPLRAGETHPRRFYYLHVYDNPHRVHLSTTLDAEAQLFARGSAVPRAFLDTQQNLALFNSETGCVHIIHGLGDIEGSSSSPEDGYLRINIPYEEYFKCDRPLENPNPNRCNLVKGGGGGQGQVTSGPQGPPSNNPDHPTPPDYDNANSRSGMGRIAAVCLVVALLLLLAVGVFYVTMSKNKKAARGRRGGRGKWTTVSSSAVDSTVFKTGNKRTTTRISSFTGRSKTSTGRSLRPGQAGRNCSPRLAQTPQGAMSLAGNSSAFDAAQRNLAKTLKATVSPSAASDTSKTVSKMTTMRSAFKGRSKAAKAAKARQGAKNRAPK